MNDLIAECVEESFRLVWENFDKWYVYSYHHIDYLCAMSDAGEMYKRLPGGDSLLRRIAQRFRRAGWEGDGEIQLFWLPPFVFEDTDTVGVCCFHVKQGNNGTSWIASPDKLLFNLDEEP